MKETSMSDVDQTSDRPSDRPIDRPSDRHSGRHPVSIGHLVMGLAFLGLVAVWALVEGGVVDNRDIRWLPPLPWVVAGIVGLLATTLTSRDRWGPRQTGWVGDQPRDWGNHQSGWVGDGPAAGATPEPTTEVTTPIEQDPTEENR
jgi:hypothetical protein